MSGMKMFSRLLQNMIEWVIRMQKSQIIAQTRLGCSEYSATNITAMNILHTFYCYGIRASQRWSIHPERHEHPGSNDACILGLNVSSSLIHICIIQPATSRCVNMLGIACLMCGFPPGESSWPCGSPVLKSFQSQGLIRTNTLCNLDKNIL